VHAAEAGPVVSAAADRDVEPLLAAEVDRDDDVVPVGAASDQRRAFVDHGVVESPNLVVVGIARAGHASVQLFCERVDVADVKHLGHLPSPLWVRVRLYSGVVHASRAGWGCFQDVRGGLVLPYACRVERFDAIVVGAGPAGSTAALRLSRAGARVLLLDRERFPRDKPCGGGLTERAVKQLPVPVDPVVEEVVDRFELGFRYGTRFERGGERPLVVMTQRRRLDSHLAEAAAAAEADFRDGVRARALELGEREATVRFDGTAAQAQVVIGADGVNGLTAKVLGFGERRHGVALEGNVSYVHAREDRWRGRAVVELGTVPGGYAWVFPKGDHINVGVGGWKSEGPRLREHLERAC